MLTLRPSSFTKIGLISFLLLCVIGSFANVDMAPDIRDCSEEKDFVQPVINGSCYGVIIGRGKELIKNRWDGENVVHQYPQWCGSAEPIDWKEANPEWKSKTCAPTYSCLENPAMDLANASYISVHEQPYENAPDVIAPIFPLDKDFLKVIVFADNASVADTADGCQYTCNDGYRISTGTCGSTSTTGFSCNGAPTLAISAPTGTITGVAATLKLNATRTGVTVDTGWSGYETSPAVIVVIPNNGTCTPYTPAVGTTVAAWVVTGAIFKVATPTVGVTRGAIQTNNLLFAVTNGGAGYSAANPPTVTIGGLTGTGCTGLTAIPRLNSRGELATIDDLTISSTCTGTPTVTISAPPALVAVTCPADTTFTVANPTGTGTVVTATATSNAQGVITITNPGAGYIVNPTVTVSTAWLTCATPPVATATIDVATKEVKTISFSATGGTAATAIANTTGTVAVIPTNGGGAGYTSAPLVTVTQWAVGGCTTLPTATATISTAGVVTGVTLTGANQCTVAPILTIAPPWTACATGSSVTKCIANACTGTRPTDAIFCTDDTKIGGHEDVASVRRATVGSCTDPQKCEWYCPAEKPVYCELQNTCAKTLDECACPSGQQQCSDGTCAVSCNTCATSAPSQLKTGIDQPLIQCAAIDNTKTHFRYKIAKTRGTSTDAFISDLYTVGTTVKHTESLAVGTYTVTCLYGTSASTDATSMQVGTCTKPMEVKASTDNTVQGCNRIYSYKGNSLSDDMWSSSAFDASFRCGSRLAATGITNPYRLAIGTQTPAFLQYDQDISNLFNGLAIGPVSTQTQNYTFSTSTDTYCAVKVGDGYSTNNSCKVRSCVGAECSTPQTFIIVPSSNAVCTDETDFTYDIGCNEESTDYTQCVAWLYGNTATNRTIKVKVNGVDQDRLIQCKSSRPDGALGDVITCTMLLPTGGMPVTVFSGDNTSFQTTLYTLSRDTQSPTGTLEYFTNYSANTKLDPSQYNLWQRQPITAVITCTDLPGTSDGSSCSCASELKNDTNGIWSLGVRSTNTSIGPDIMKYSRVINNSSPTAPYAVTIEDTAQNIWPAYTPNIGVDTVPPKVTASISGTIVTLNVSDSSDGGSGLWKPNNGIPSGVDKNTPTGAILYRVWPKSSQAALEFGTTCISPTNNTNYYHLNEAGVDMSQIFSKDITNATTNIIAYCVEDNAWNVTRGVYPSDAVGCFSASNMNPVPTITTYKTPLQAAITANNYGYSLSENATNATCFRGILSNNINTLVTSQYNSSTAQSLNWNQAATLKNTSTPNTNGYYYFSGISGNTLSIDSTPTGTGSKAVIVEGGNIQINQNIDYSGTDKTLILIARKNTTTNVGWNIYINPSVTRIDAIIIADGAMINATTTGTTTTTKNWIDNPNELSNRLTINWRLYSFNTRGGSLVVSGSDLVKTTTTGRVFNASTLVTNATPAVAAASDLERFRVILNDGNAFCTTQVNYDTLVGSALPPLLQRPSGYTGGTCSF